MLQGLISGAVFNQLPTNPLAINFSNLGGSLSPPILGANYNTGLVATSPMLPQSNAVYK